MKTRAFPNDLARIVAARWDKLVAGDYKAPDCPETPLLRGLLEIAYLAANVPEEGRYPEFNILAVRRGQPIADQQTTRTWPFDSARPLTVEELRRLAPATDLRKSAILVDWEEDWRIIGLVDLGTSWHRARMGLEYRYDHPTCLLVQIYRPGRIRVYQGAYHVATLSEGVIDTNNLDFRTFLHEPVNSGLRAMHSEWSQPEHEHPRETAEFAFIALWNTFAGIANSISLQGHGGAIAIVPTGITPSSDLIRIKYKQDTSVIRSAFTEFMSARNKFWDLVAREQNGEAIAQGEIAIAELWIVRRFALLVEAIRFIAKLADCDGAIVLSADLKLFGFGGEIRAEFRQGAKVFEVTNELSKKHRALDIEQFGLRHRSAVKLVSQNESIRALVISQDGPTSVIWSEKKDVLVKKGVNLVNLDMPWA